MSGSLAGIPAISAVCVILCWYSGRGLWPSLLNLIHIPPKPRVGYKWEPLARSGYRPLRRAVNSQEGTLSSLAFVICGIITSLIAPFLFPVILAVMG
ncbi:LrgB family protein [Shigella flexneri]